MKLNAIMATVVAALMFSACAKTNDTVDATDGALYMGFSISLPENAFSKAYNGDQNATEAESKITSVDVFVYGQGDGAFHSARFAAVDFTLNSNGTYIAKKAVKTTEGNKHIVVGVNIPAAIADELVASRSEQFLNQAKEQLVSDFVTSDGIVMFSTAESAGAVVKVVKGTNAYQTEDEAVAGVHIATAVERSVAKVSVTYDDAFSAPGNTDAYTSVVKQTGYYPYAGNVDHANIAFALEFTNKRLYYVQNSRDGIVVDPASAARTDDNTNRYGPATTAFTWQQAIEKPTAAWTDAQLSNALFCFESALNSKPVIMGEKTMAVICVPFAPKATDYADGAWQWNQYAAPATYYVYTGIELNPMPSENGKVATNAYFTAAGKARFIAENANVREADFTEYVDGKNYYYVNVNKAEPEFNKVLRNHFYKINIKTVTLPGGNTPDVDITDPIAEDVFISVDLDVEPWQVVENDYDLTK